MDTAITIRKTNATIKARSTPRRSSPNGRFFFLDLKENARGRFVKITEDVRGRRDTIMLPSEHIQDFLDALTAIRDADDELE